MTGTKSNHVISTPLPRQSGDRVSRAVSHRRHGRGVMRLLELMAKPARGPVPTKLQRPEMMTLIFLGLSFTQASLAHATSVEDRRNESEARRASPGVHLFLAGFSFSEADV